jgi:low temperature requirement protein LtrA
VVIVLLLPFLMEERRARADSSRPSNALVHTLAGTAVHLDSHEAGGETSCGSAGNGEAVADERIHSGIGELGPSTADRRRRVAATAQEHRVTPRELFFDLVFVFAFTQVAQLLTHDPTFAGIGHGVLVLAALWWAWASYAALTNTVDPEVGVVGAALLVALIAMFIAALVVPHVFGDNGVLFGAAFLVVCATHVALYALAGRGDPDLLGAVLRLAPWTLLGATLILLAGFTDGARTLLWLAGLACAYGGGLVTGSAGWMVHASHFAERYALVIIIALGEAFIAIGIGASGISIGFGEVVAAILGLLVATSFWLAYFDFFSIRGEQVLRQADGPARVALARDVYTYLHFPMIVGIVLFAFAMKNVIAHLGHELDWVVAFALCGGSAIYLLTYSAIRIRVERRFRLSRGRFTAAILFLLVLPIATTIPALATLALVMVVWLALHTYELVWWREARAESRSALTSS